MTGSLISSFVDWMIDISLWSNGFLWTFCRMYLIWAALLLGKWCLLLELPVSIHYITYMWDGDIWLTMGFRGWGLSIMKPGLDNNWLSSLITLYLLLSIKVSSNDLYLCRQIQHQPKRKAFLPSSKSNLIYFFVYFEKEGSVSMVLLV